MLVEFIISFNHVITSEILNNMVVFTYTFSTSLELQRELFLDNKFGQSAPFLLKKAHPPGKHQS